MDGIGKAYLDVLSKFVAAGGKFDFGRYNHKKRDEAAEASALIACTKCAMCVNLGHWGRNCTDPFDERAKRRTGMTGFVMTAIGATDGDSVFHSVQHKRCEIQHGPTGSGTTAAFIHLLYL